MFSKLAPGVRMHSVCSDPVDSGEISHCADEVSVGTRVTPNI